MANYSIAIDGPSGAGKSTIAKRLAQELEFEYLDTGAMYRAITLYVLEHGVDPDDEAAVCGVLDEIDLSIRGSRVLLNGTDVSEKIRSQLVTTAVSPVSSYRAVRERMVAMQREACHGCNVILDGRDIGTTVLPDASLKFYLTASAQERAFRRLHDQKNKSSNTYEEVLADILRRDRYDSSRDISPLRKAEDAVEIDSTDMSIDEVLTFMKQKWEERVHVL